MSTLPHKEAFLDQIRLDAELAECTWEGVVLPDANGNRPERYVSVFFPSPTHTPTRYTGEATRESYTVTTHSVGLDPNQAQDVSDRLTRQLLGRRLAVAGRDCSRIEHPTGLPPEIDKDPNPPLFYIVDEWTFWSDPA